MKLIKLMTVCYFAIVSALFIGGVSSSVAQAQDKVVWIDVRTEAEWNQGHLKNAILIPYDEITKKIHTVVKTKRQPVNLYCRSGRRAEIARKALEQMGYINVQNRGSFEMLRQSMP